jgi:hypothetical protein
MSRVASSALRRGGGGGPASPPRGWWWGEAGRRPLGGWAGGVEGHAAPPRHVEVEEDGGRTLAPRAVEALRAARRLQELERKAAERVLQRVPRELVVVDREYRAACGPGDAPQRVHEPGALERLREVGVGPEAQGLYLVGHVRDHEHRELAVLALLHLREQGPAVLAAELDVEDHRRRSRLAQSLARSGDARGGDDLELGVAQQGLVDQELLGRVLHHQHGNAEGIARLGLRRRRGLRGDRRVVDEGDLQGEGGSHSGRALQRDRALEEVRELAAKRQPQPGPLHPLLYRVVDLLVVGEDPLLVLGCDADAGIGDREDDRPRVRLEPRGHTDLAPLGELQGVGDEVPDDL